MTTVPLFPFLVMAVIWVWTQPAHPMRGADLMTKRGGMRRVSGSNDLDMAVVCDLLCVALRAGASLPRACEAVGAVAGGAHGMALLRAAKALRLGAPWDSAWAGHVLGDVLSPAWLDGADPAPLIEQLARSIRANRAAAAKQAAAKLSVRLVLPIGLCLLPAFILVGIVPLLLGGSAALLG